MIKESKESILNNLNEVYAYSTQTFSSRTAFRTYGDTSKMTYNDFRLLCETLSLKLTDMGICEGDRVAILSENRPGWAVAFFSIAAHGRVAVPILPDASASEVENILKHSGCKAVFASKCLRVKLADCGCDVLDIEMAEDSKASDTNIFAPSNNPAPDTLAAIIYTSGTSGAAKGVMLSHENLCQNIRAARAAQPATSRYVWLSILPAAHAYELSLGLLYPFSIGASVCYLGKMPTPTILSRALLDVRPMIVCSVPLVIEKIYNKKVLPSIRSNRMLSWMDAHTPHLLHRLIGLKLRNAFGGRLRFFGVGGAKLDGEVEAFLHDARFPYAIGYGMTETAPLICNAVVGRTSVGSIGVPAQGMKVKLLNTDPATGVGELAVKGPAVMLGYYNDPDRTSSLFTNDGWMRTRDLATQDRKGRYFLCGRADSVIVGPNGENIYPEEIEMIINRMPTVEESLVVNDGGRLVALVRLAEGVVDWVHEGEIGFADKLKGLKATIQQQVNAKVGKQSRIVAVALMRQPFLKTATNKIRRFLYLKPSVVPSA